MGIGRYFQRMAPKKHKFLVFDDQSRYLDRFGLVLILTVVSIVLLSLCELYQPENAVTGRLSSVVAALIVGLTLILALRASGVARVWQMLVDIAVFVIVVSAIILNATDTYFDLDPDRRVSAPILLVVLSALAPVVIVRRLTQHRRITRGTLFGAISAYLLIPVMYFYIFITLNDLQAQPFFGVQETSPSYMYFSLTTLTTIGYGDLTSQTNLGHLMSTSEAVVGQVYLVSFVAMLVGLFAQQWQQSRNLPEVAEQEQS